MTTIEQAQEYGYLTLDQVRQICKEHSVPLSDAVQCLGDSCLDAEALMIWLGY